MAPGEIELPHVRPTAMVAVRESQIEPAGHVEVAKMNCNLERSDGLAACQEKNVSFFDFSEIFFREIRHVALAHESGRNVTY
ncbi:MAG: hypothetical protein HY290_33585 [Planctomycetia bacterium]|nr:hypothetical protein [Planctomycetia bacterium]